MKLQVRYWTDGAAVGRGFEFDDLAITAGATTVFSDGAENGDNGWTLDGFRRTAGTETTEPRTTSGRRSTSLSVG